MAVDSTVARIIDALRDHGCTVKESTDSAMAQCPAHVDDNPSLSIAPRKDGRGAVIHCHAGCEYTDVLTELGLADTDLFNDTGILDALRPSKTYVYSGGRKNHRNISPEGKKTFWQEGSDDKSLYAIEAISDTGTVYLCEGEKAADMLRALGHNAVATGGAQRSCDLTPLGDRDVIIIADRDKAGYEWAQRHAIELATLAHAVGIVQAKVDIAKADIVEHVAAGYGITELEPVTLPSTNGHKLVHLLPAAQIRSDVPSWAWRYDGQGRIQRGTLAILAGRPGVGKSNAARWFAAGYSNGTMEGDWYGKPVNVAYISPGEESHVYVIKPGLDAIGADPQRIFFPEIKNDEGNPGKLMGAMHRDALVEAFREAEIRVVIVDPIMSTIPGTANINQNNETRMHVEPWAQIATAIDGIVLGIAHFTKFPGNDLVAAINGSSAFGEVARAIFAFVKDRKTGERVFSQVKNSTGMEDLSRKYEIKEATVPTDSGGEASVAVFVIGERSELTASDIMGADADGDVTIGRADIAQLWLTDYLEMQGRARPKDIIKDAKDEGHAQATIYRAAKKIGVEVIYEDMPRKAWWTLPISYYERAKAEWDSSIKETEE